MALSDAWITAALPGDQIARDPAASLGSHDVYIERAASTLGVAQTGRALNWIADTLLATSLLDQIDEATDRITRPI
ncbi:MAG TPA: hypothetical protein VGR57_04885 [Ktedonobacterales bacterium]|nr:hypothetical protein [Ktedonobacterales bacterium]